MIYFPPCKINLGLHILQKRADGYHELETGMLEIPFQDILEIIPCDEFRFSSSGLEIPGGTNSCIAAYDLLKQRFALPPVHIHLHKMVPMGGGLGGGSSDSTSVLKALNQRFQLGLTKDELKDFAALLGSDNAFFVEGGLQLAKGRGELLEPLHLSSLDFRVCIINIGVHVSTKDAYAQVVPFSARTDLRTILQQHPDTWKSDLVNDFEPSVFAKFPELAKLKSEFYDNGAIYAAMSGSASSCIQNSKKTQVVRNCTFVDIIVQIFTVIGCWVFGISF